MTRVVECAGVTYAVDSHPTAGWVALRPVLADGPAVCMPVAMAATFRDVTPPGRRDAVINLDVLGVILGRPDGVELYDVEPLAATRQVRFEFRSTRWEPDAPGTAAQQLPFKLEYQTPGRPPVPSIDFNN